MGELRQHERRTLRVGVRVEAAGEILDGTTVDLSLGGAQVELPRDLPFGSRASVRLSLPAIPGESVIEAEVRWSRPADGGFHVGLRFLRVRARETWALNELVRRAAAGGSSPATDDASQEPSGPARRADRPTKP